MFHRVILISWKCPLKVGQLIGFFSLAVVGMTQRSHRFQVMDSNALHAPSSSQRATAMQMSLSDRTFLFPGCLLCHQWRFLHTKHPSGIFHTRETTTSTRQLESPSQWCNKYIHVLQYDRNLFVLPNGYFCSSVSSPKTAFFFFFCMGNNLLLNSYKE